MTKTGWLSEIPEMEREAEDHELRARALRQMIEAVRVLNGHAVEVSDPLFVSQNGKMFVAQPLDRFGPRGRAAVVRVMKEAPDRLWKVVELKQELLRRGWSPSPKAVEACVKRLRQTGEIESPRYGFYKLRRDDGEEPAIMDVQSL